MIQIGDASIDRPPILALIRENLRISEAVAAAPAVPAASPLRSTSVGCLSCPVGRIDSDIAITPFCSLLSAVRSPPILAASSHAHAAPELRAGAAC
jgi:hypothetical protein